jgi:hypothetical protein
MDCMDQLTKAKLDDVLQQDEPTILVSQRVI